MAPKQAANAVDKIVVPDVDDFKIVDDDIVKTIESTFSISEDDDYHYYTEGGGCRMADARLAFQSRAQYQYAMGGQLVTIPVADIRAYVDVFRAGTDTDKSLRSFLQNAKKDSPRRKVAEHLSARRYIDPALAGQLTKRKKHINPYFDLWALSCEQLGFVGPLPGSYEHPQAAKQSHPILPVFMHHFGCGIPDYEALSIVRAVVGKRRLVDLGCGNAYWTWLLRREGLSVTAVDDLSSRWRTTWASDIVKSDAVQFVQKSMQKEDVLLLVYPIVGGNDLTKRIIQAYKGDTLIIAGTQNNNRYTTFADASVDDWFAGRKEWQLLARKPLPSFVGKDDALFVYKRQPQ